MSIILPKIPIIEYKFEKNQKYQGSIINGCPEGKGILSLPEQSIILEGLFKDGMFYNGKMTFGDGSYFKGRFNNHKSTLKGVYSIPGEMEISSNFYEGQIGYQNVKIKFESGDLFKGTWIQDFQMVDGSFLQKSRHTGNFTKFDFYVSSSSICMHENLDLGGLYYFLGVESFKCTNKSKGEFILVYKNGDILTGVFEKLQLQDLTFTGTITYSDDRYSPFTGKIKENVPISGKGVCFLYHEGVVYQGDFESGGEYTITEQDGTVHRVTSEEGGQFKKEITYPDGKEFIGTFDRQNLTSYPISGGGFFKPKGKQIEIQALVINQFFMKCKISNMETETIFNIRFMGKDLSTITSANENMKINFKDGSSTLVTFRCKEIGEVEGQNYEFPGKEGILKISKIIDSKNNKKNLEVEGIRYKKESGIEEVGRFQFSQFGDADLLEGIVVYETGFVEEQIVKRGSQNSYIRIGEFLIQDMYSNFLEFGRRTHFMICKMGDDQIELGWKRKIENDLVLVEGDTSNDLRNVNGLVVFKKGDKNSLEDRSPGIMVFGKGVIIQDVSEFEELRVEEGNVKKILVFGEDNSLEYQTCI